LKSVDETLVEGSGIEPAERRILKTEVPISDLPTVVDDEDDEEPDENWWYRYINFDTSSSDSSSMTDSEPDMNAAAIPTVREGTAPLSVNSAVDAHKHTPPEPPAEKPPAPTLPVRYFTMRTYPHGLNLSVPETVQLRPDPSRYGDPPLRPKAPRIGRGQRVRVFSPQDAMAAIDHQLYTALARRLSAAAPKPMATTAQRVDTPQMANPPRAEPPAQEGQDDDSDLDADGETASTISETPYTAPVTDRPFSLVISNALAAIHSSNAALDRIRTSNAALDRVRTSDAALPRPSTVGGKRTIRQMHAGPSFTPHARTFAANPRTTMEEHSTPFEPPRKRARRGTASTTSTSERRVTREGSVQMQRATRAVVKKEKKEKKVVKAKPKKA
jgi:hypothetical protein